jgi:hypothetical protein
MTGTGHSRFSFTLGRNFEPEVRIGFRDQFEPDRPDLFLLALSATAMPASSSPGGSSQRFGGRAEAELVGGKSRLRYISKTGNGYLRKMFIGAHNLVSGLHQSQTRDI